MQDENWSLKGNTLKRIMMEVWCWFRMLYCLVAAPLVTYPRKDKGT